MPKVNSNTFRIDVFFPFIFLLIAGCQADDTDAVIYVVGESGPAGGIVFHVSEEGRHGMEIAPVSLVPDDQSDFDKPGYHWGCRVMDGMKFHTGEGIGAGAENTKNILSACPEADNAARIADEYELNGYNDWFLPSRDELLEFSKKTLAPPEFWSNDLSVASRKEILEVHKKKVAQWDYAREGYWSSSTARRGFAYYQPPGTTLHTAWHWNKHPVRPVRAF